MIQIYASYPISFSLASKCCSLLLFETTFRSSRLHMFFKITVNFVFKISQYLQGNTCVGTTLLKRDSTLMNIFKSSFFQNISLGCFRNLHYFLNFAPFCSNFAFFFYDVHKQLQNDMRFFSFCIVILVKMITSIQKQKCNTIAKLKEECQQNFDDELRAK